MTLVFMEREYSSPEEPHLGIVHMVEVSAPPGGWWSSRKHTSGSVSYQTVFCFMTEGNSLWASLLLISSSFPPAPPAPPLPPASLLLLLTGEFPSRSDW